MAQSEFERQLSAGAWDRRGAAGSPAPDTRTREVCDDLCSPWATSFRGPAPRRQSAIRPQEAGRWHPEKSLVSGTRIWITHYSTSRFALRLSPRRIGRAGFEILRARIQPENHKKIIPAVLRCRGHRDERCSQLSKVFLLFWAPGEVPLLPIRPWSGRVSRCRGARHTSAPRRQARRHWWSVAEVGSEVEYGAPNRPAEFRVSAATPKAIDSQRMFLAPRPPELG